MKKCSLPLSMILVAGAGLAVLAISTPVYAQGTTHKSEQNRKHSADAYRDGYLHGRDDAKAGVRNNSPGDRWTLPGDQAAWRNGYFEGYQEVRSEAYAKGYQEGYKDIPH